MARNITPLNPQAKAFSFETTPTFIKRCFQIRLHVNNSSISSKRTVNCSTNRYKSFKNVKGKSSATPPGLIYAECKRAPETRS